MKRELKGFIIGVILTMAFSVSADVWQSISVQPNSVNIVVNGEKINVDNFLYNDTTYIPIRAVSTALSQYVSYDDKTNTAYIGKKGIDKVETTELKLPRWEKSDILKENGIDIDENDVRYYSKEDINKELLKNIYVYVVISDEIINITLRKGNINTHQATDEIIKENIPYKMINDRIRISEKYFTEEILPLDK